MKVVNTTPFTTAPVPARLNFPGHSLTIVVKGTFALRPGGAMEPAEEQLFPDGDAFYPDDAEGTGSLRYEADFAPIKPTADALFVGSAHAPGGTPTPSVTVHFSVGQARRDLVVVGDRRSAGRSSPPPPESFTSMPIRYERAYGGADYPFNPAGTGDRAQIDDRTGERISVWPNIFDARDVQWSAASANIEGESARGRRESASGPAGFAPIPRHWKSRASKLGTYGEAWLKTRFPAFPSDFDPSYFNAASPDLILPGFFEGNEEVRMINLHPTVSEYRCRLPGLRVRVFRNDLAEVPPMAGPIQAPPGTREQVAAAGTFREVPVVLDTLWVDGDHETAVLLWRGHTPVSDEDFEEIGEIFVLAEPLDAAPMGVDACRAKFLEAIRAEEIAPEPEPDSSEESGGGEPGEEVSEPVDESTREQVEAELNRQNAPADLRAKVMLWLSGTEDDALRHIRRELRETAAAKGINPDHPVVLTAEQQARKIKWLEQIGVDPAEALAAERARPSVLAETPKEARERERREAAEARADFERALFAAGASGRMRALCLEIYDLEPGKRQERLERDMRLVKRKLGLDPDQPLELTPDQEVRRAELLREFGLDEESVQIAIRAEEEARAEQAAANRDAPPLTRDEVIRRHAEKESLAGERLQGVDLSGLDLSGIDLEGAKLRGANLREANLAGASLGRADLSMSVCTRANFSGSTASMADFSGAMLDDINAVGADFSAAIFITAKLRRSVLDGSLLEHAALEGVDATDCSAKETIFAGCEARDAVFNRANLEKADFSRSMLAGASFQLSRLVEASFADADMTRCVLSGSNITNLRASGATILEEAKLEQVRGEKTVWQRCNLRNADLRFANIPKADFSNALLDGADLSAVNMPESIFRKASLRGTRLIAANLFTGSMEKADLTNANFSGANLYGVEFLDAKAPGAIGDGANLKMTKLAKA